MKGQLLSKNMENFSPSVFNKAGLSLAFVLWADNVSLHGGPAPWTQRQNLTSLFWWTLDLELFKKIKWINLTHLKERNAILTHYSSSVIAWVKQDTFYGIGLWVLWKHRHLSFHFILFCFIIALLWYNLYTIQFS